MVAVNDKKLFIGQGARLASVNRDVAVLVKIEFWNAEDLVEPNTMSSRALSQNRISIQDVKMRRRKSRVDFYSVLVQKYIAQTETRG